MNCLGRAEGLEWLEIVPDANTEEPGKVSKILSQVQCQLMELLGDSGQAVEVRAAAQRLSLNQSPVAAAAAELAEQGLIEIKQEPYEEYSLGRKAQWDREKGLPEGELVEALAKAGGEGQIKELSEHCGLSGQEMGSSVRFLELKGWAKRTGALLKLTQAGRKAIGSKSADEQLLAALSEAGRAMTDEELKAKRLDLAQAVRLLKPRGGWLSIKQRSRRMLSLSKAGTKALAEGVSYQEEINQLTPELLAEGKWREVKIRPYDVSLPAARIQPGKGHPFARMLKRVRRVFLEMGFTQISSPLVESSFWDFDALFQPQDHPARDMQDTFYVARPSQTKLPGKQLVERVKQTHENGGQTGSLGWQYKWDIELAKKAVLRTHTTATTIRALAQNPKGPQKVFGIGPAFRRETVDYKHLPVFHQVDGIIVDGSASLASLLGTLDVFYRKMGFEKLQFRPDFFPYTEPSLEVSVWNEERQDWMEMGGAGIFRAEVTQPLGCTEPVLAWGLGLERLAMLQLGLNDIRELFYAHLDWLEETPLCL